jgi:hypothetical protein
MRGMCDGAAVMLLQLKNASTGRGSIMVLKRFLFPSEQPTASVYSVCVQFSGQYTGCACVCVHVRAERVRGSSSSIYQQQC